MFGGDGRKKTNRTRVWQRAITEKEVERGEKRQIQMRGIGLRDTQQLSNGRGPRVREKYVRMQGAERRRGVALPSEAKSAENRKIQKRTIVKKQG